MALKRCQKTRRQPPEGRTTDDYFYKNALSYVAIFFYGHSQDPLAGANEWMTWFVRERAPKCSAVGPKALH